MKTLLSIVLVCCAPLAAADAITTWNKIACDAVMATPMVPPMATRILAIMHTADFEAANAITGRYPVHLVELVAPRDASVDAAVAAASRAVLLELLPGQKAAVELAYGDALAPLPANAQRDA